jgi:NitT/TauT family transport system substrate-binding protein
MKEVIMQSRPGLRMTVKASLVAAVMALGVASAPLAQAQERLKLRLILPSAPTTFLLPYMVPKDRGWYAERGLDVEETFVNGDATALRSVISGSADLTIIGPPTVMQAVSEGAKLKYIGSVQPKVDYQVVAQKSITSLAQLADKTFASAGPSDMTTEIPRLVLRKAGVPTEGVKFLQVGGHSARLQALEAGKVQGTMVNTLTTLIGERHGAINVLSKIGADFPKIGYEMIVANAADMDNPAKRRAFEIFIKGIIYGSREIEANPQATGQILAKRVPDLPPDLILAALKELNTIKAWGTNGGIDREMVTYTSDALVNWKMLSRPVTPDELVDDRFVKGALAEMGTK